MSKLTFFDFHCPYCELVFEDLVKPDIRQAQCPKCQSNAVRIVSPVKIDRLRIALTEGASPESLAYFDRVHKEQAAKEAKTHAEHGDYGPRPGAG